MQKDIPESYEAMYLTCDHLIAKQIFSISHGRCSKDERDDIKQEVYLRAQQKDFLGRTAVLFAERGDGCFEKQLYHLTRSVTANHFEHHASRPLRHAMTGENADALDRLLIDVEAAKRADAVRHQEATDELDLFWAWLQTRRGAYARAQHADLAEVYRLWREFGESRHVTHQIAKHLHLTDAWVRSLKQRVRVQYMSFRKEKIDRL